jgi:hypothetical protein
LLHDTEAVTSVVEHASDYERMIAATEKFHRDVVGIRGFSTSRYGLSLGRGDSLSQARSDFDSSDSLVGDDEYHRNPSFLRDPEVTEFERFSMATNAFHALNQRSNDDVISGDDVTSPGGADGEDAPRIRSFPFAAQSPDPDEIPRNFPVHDDDDVAGINLWPQDDFREKSLNRVAALNKDANALEQDKKHVDECEAEFNKALRAMNEKVEKGERSADEEEVSRLATKLAEARQNYQQSEEKLHRDVEELKKSVVGATDESNPQVDQLKRATLEFQQSMEPLRDRSMTRQQAASSSPAAAAANRSKSGDVTPVKSKRPPAVKSNKKNVAKTPVREPRATPSAKKAAPTATTEAETDESLTFM